MTRRQIVFAGIAALLFIFAVLLHDVIEQIIIIPLAYLLWLLKLYYAMFPQFILWVILISIVFYSAITNLIPEIGPRKTEKIKTKPIEGRIETLTGWIKKSRHGTYHKWLIANRLGKNAREILTQRDGNTINKKFRRLTGHGWNPPKEIGDYLESGLNDSFADFPRPRWFWQSPPSTPLDVDPQQVMDYLEDEMEMTNGRDHKSI